jgi:hypothetical protein
MKHNLTRVSASKQIEVCLMSHVTSSTSLRHRWCHPPCLPILNTHISKMASISRLSAARGASNKSTLESRRRIDIHNTLTAFIDLQEGNKTLRELYPAIADYVRDQHTVIWTSSDVRSVFRAAEQRASSIHSQDERWKKLQATYKEEEKRIERDTHTRKAKEKKWADIQHIYDEYHNHKEPHHTPLVHAQLALNASVQRMKERSSEIVKEKKMEAARKMEEDRKRREEEQEEGRRKKRDQKEEKEQKAMEERQKREAEKEEGARARNAKIAVDLAAVKIEEYKRKKEEARLRVDFMKVGKELMLQQLDMNKQKAREARREEKGEEDSADEKENQMPE